MNNFNFYIIEKKMKKARFLMIHKFTKRHLIDLSAWVLNNVWSQNNNRNEQMHILESQDINR